VYDKKLEKEGRNRFEIGKDQLYKEILEFTLANKKVMENQLKRLGASCDWSREKFTLDENIVKVVDDGREIDSIFYYPKLQKSFCELSIGEKNQVSHRGQAIEQVKIFLGRQYGPARFVVPVGILIKDKKTFHTDLIYRQMD
jgi:hypothetical protein